MRRDNFTEAEQELGWTGLSNQPGKLNLTSSHYRSFSQKHQLINIIYFNVHLPTGNLLVPVAYLGRYWVMALLWQKIFPLKQKIGKHSLASPFVWTLVTSENLSSPFQILYTPLPVSRRPSPSVSKKSPGWRFERLSERNKYYLGWR